ncbi:MAG: inositol monophosphatase family protein [Prochlorotrichaceae cyanobacterium]
MFPNPRAILDSLFPTLHLAAHYAREIQPRIAAQPDKPDAGSTFAAALSDADLSIQTAVEVALLGAFPGIHFYGEEYEKSYNTKYFKSLQIPEDDNYLVLLDPIDGTQFYLDGHKNYHIMLSVVDRQDYCAALIINPPSQTYYYALRGEGAYQGQLSATIGQSSLKDAAPLRLNQENLSQETRIYLGSQLADIANHIPHDYEVINLAIDYSKTVQVFNHTGILDGGLQGSALASNKLIDVAAVAFIAQEAGFRVSTLGGNPLPPMPETQNHSRSGGVIIAATQQIHDLLVGAAIASGF